MTMSDQFDVVVIGGGPGGYCAALYGASAGLKMAMVEKDALGGTCLNRGCIPAKAFLETAAVQRHVEHAAEFGIESSAPSVNFAVTQERKQRIVDGLVEGIAAMCKGRKVEVFNGVGSLGPTTTVTVTAPDGTSDTRSGVDNVILATGSVPRLIPELRARRPDHDQRRGARPRRRAGARRGDRRRRDRVRVRVDVRRPRRAGDDPRSPAQDPARPRRRRRQRRRAQLQEEEDRHPHRRQGHRSHADGYGGTTVQFGDGESVDVDAGIVSVGRRPFADQLGLDGTAVEVDERGFVDVDEFCRTGEPGVYAVGDLIDTPQLAHVGYAEAIMVIKHMLGENPMPVMYDRVPWAIYCHPEVAWAGPGEDAAAEAGIDVVVGKHPYKFNSRAQIVGETEGMVKVVAQKNPDGSPGQVLGVHMVGPWVTEQLVGGYLAVNWEATVAEVAEFIQPHPSLSELFGETMLSLTGRDFNG